MTEEAFFLCKIVDEFGMIRQIQPLFDDLAKGAGLMVSAGTQREIETP